MMIMGISRITPLTCIQRLMVGSGGGMYFLQSGSLEVMLEGQSEVSSGCNGGSGNSVN